MSHHNTYDQDTINRVVASLRVENRSMICDMLIQTADRADAAEQERDALRAVAERVSAYVGRLEAALAQAEQERAALRAECDEWRQNYAALEAVALASERARHAVPVEAIRSVIDALVEGRFEDTAGGAALVCMWLDAQREAVQP